MLFFQDINTELQIGLPIRGICMIFHINGHLAIYGHCIISAIYGFKTNYRLLAWNCWLFLLQNIQKTFVAWGVAPPMPYDIPFEWTMTKTMLLGDLRGTTQVPQAGQRGASLRSMRLYTGIMARKIIVKAKRRMSGL